MKLILGDIQEWVNLRQHLMSFRHETSSEYFDIIHLIFLLTLSSGRFVLIRNDLF
jgi:hypothetical protein